MAIASYHCSFHRTRFFSRLRTRRRSRTTTPEPEVSSQWSHTQHPPCRSHATFTFTSTRRWPSSQSWHCHHHHHHHHGGSGSSIGVHRHTGIRGLVTSYVSPSLDVFIERPEAMVLMESSLYQHSWEDFCTKFYPSHGLHFASIDIMKQQNQQQKGMMSSALKKKAPGLSLKSLERNMADDLARLGEMGENIGDAEFFVSGQAPIVSTSAYSVLIARGPVQCLVAQYFLESSPLAGLVMVDPLLLPVDGRRGKKKDKDHDESRWKSSLLDFIAVLENRAPQMYNNNAMIDKIGGKDSVDSPLLLPRGTRQSPEETVPTIDSTSTELEIAFLHSLASDDKGARPLRLEPGSVPTLVLYSGGDHMYHDYYRLCSERTAAFHTCGGKGDYFDQVSVLKIPNKRGAVDMNSVDDLDLIMRKIYEWYDEVVA